MSLINEKSIPINTTGLVAVSESIEFDGQIIQFNNENGTIVSLGISDTHQDNYELTLPETAPPLNVSVLKSNVMGQLSWTKLESQPSIYVVKYKVVAGTKSESTRLNTWIQRKLNYIADSDASERSFFQLHDDNTFTLQPGIWYIDAVAPASGVGNTQLRLCDTRNPTHILDYGISLTTNHKDNHILVPLTTVLKIREPKTLSLQQYCQFHGFLGTPIYRKNRKPINHEVYTSITLTKTG